MQEVRLDRNENHYGPAPECIAIARSITPDLVSEYTRDFERGHYSQLSRVLSERHGVEEKRIILGYGAEDVLKQAVHHYLRAGEPCLVPSASWWYYNAIADEVGGIRLEYPILEGVGSFYYDLDQLKRIHTERRAKVLLVSSPNNPTGNLFPRERLAEILEHFRDAVVIYDEAYLGFADEPQEDIAVFANTHPNLLILRSFSKLYGLAGMRIGYGIAGKGLEGFLKFSARYLGYNRLSEKLALAALRDTTYYDDVRRRFARDRRRLQDTLAKYEGVRVYRSQANFVLVHFPERLVAQVKSGLDQRGLIVKFLSEPHFKSCARITLGTETENTLLLEALRELLQRHSAAELVQSRSAP